MIFIFYFTKANLITVLKILDVTISTGLKNKNALNLTISMEVTDITSFDNKKWADLI